MKNVLIATVLTLAGLPAACAGSGSEDSWDNLKRLRPGQKIAVVDAKGRPLEGAFRGYSDESLTLLRDSGEVRLPRDQVFSVKDRERSHRRRNVLLGLAIGAGGGLAAAAIKGATYHEEGETGVFAMVFTPIGAGIGAAAGAVAPTGSVTVYRKRLSASGVHGLDQGANIAVAEGK